jgi:glycyl-tRNA synthetase beta chain
MRELLFEIGVEEMPASAVIKATEQLRQLAHQAFKENRLNFKSLYVLSTPRRLALFVKGLKEFQEDYLEEVKGPPASAAFDKKGAPTSAALGFARSQGVKPEDLVVKSTLKGDYAFALKRQRGKATSQILKKVLPNLVTSLNFPKSMRWNEKLKFIRPIRWLCALYGQEVISFKLENLKSDRYTWGHRFLAPKNPIELADALSYLTELKKAKVIVDQEKRREIILKGIEEVTKGEGKAILTPAVLEEVLYLVEFPSAIYGQFEGEFLKLPEEVIINVLQSHQRYFAVKDREGRLKANFLVVQNGDPKAEKLIRQGHERVVRARLADAWFFYEEDKKIPLEKRVEKLEGVVFQQKLGNLLDKTHRLVRLVGQVAKLSSVGQKEIEIAKRAAFLAKADLLTEMVVEFPELQGVMGREYALASGEKKAVAQAIYEHNLPRFPGDELPQSVPGSLVGLADRADTITGYFLVGLAPTGSQDPYSLRRQGYGLTQLILHHQFNLNLKKLLQTTLKLYQKFSGLAQAEETLKELESFFKNRFELTLRRLGYDDQLIASLIDEFITSPGTALKKAQAIQKFCLKKTRWDDLLTAFTRPHNLAEPKLGFSVKEELLVEETEKKLWGELKEKEKIFQKACQAENFLESLETLASFRKTIDKFFDDVLVMTDDRKIRQNRLKLLNRLDSLFLKIADFTKFGG